jgi:hypothetical protein
MVVNVNKKSKKWLQFVALLKIDLGWTSSLEPEPHRITAPALAK